MKKCSQCSRILPLDDFYNDKTKSTGKSSRCKICTKQASKEWREKYPERFREYEYQYYRANKQRFREREQRADVRRAKIKRTKKYRQQFPEKRKAQYTVENAIRLGKLIRGPCEMKNDNCSGRIEAHHDDYSKPLQVRWLCSYHHHRVHSKYPGCRGTRPIK